MEKKRADQLRPRGVSASHAKQSKTEKPGWPRRYVASPDASTHPTKAEQHAFEVETRVWTSLLGLQMAIWDATKLGAAERYLTLLVGVQTLQELLANSNDTQRSDARKAFDRVLHTLGKTPYVPGHSYHLGKEFSGVAAKRQFLELVRDILLPTLERGERQNTGPMHYTSLRRAADRQSKKPSERATSVANRIVYTLYSTPAFRDFYPLQLTPANLPEQELRIARAVDHLASCDKATAANVAWAVLVLLGRDPKGYKNFFSPKLTQDLSDVGVER